MIVLHEIERSEPVRALRRALTSPRAVWSHPFAAVTKANVGPCRRILWPGQERLVRSECPLRLHFGDGAESTW
jgi:hypothetical protein